MKTVNNKYNNFSECIGNTPLIKLNRASEITDCEIYGKCEFLNPGGSIKDRAALQILKDAIYSKKLKKGGTIVEGTAGNTGIGLTLVGNSLGLKSVIIIPETQSEEKKEMLKLCGADLIQVKALPYKDPGNYIRYSETLAKKLNNKNGVFWANQFDNVSNKKAHYVTTGPEIWNQLDGKVDGFICSVGTGGTLSGVSQFLKEKNKKIKIGLADPFGSALYNFYKSGELKAEGDSITEGIGQGRITKNLEHLELDEVYRISDNDALSEVYYLLKNEGLILGGSSGINIVGAINLAKKLGPGNTIVTILCDYGTRYQSKIFNKNFLISKKIEVPSWMK